MRRGASRHRRKDDSLAYSDRLTDWLTEVSLAHPQETSTLTMYTPAAAEEGRAGGLQGRGTHSLERSGTALRWRREYVGSRIAVEVETGG